VVVVVVEVEVEVGVEVGVDSIERNREHVSN
jgi:hypothetical protein